MAGGQGGHYAPQSQQEEQNMLDLAMALSMCEVDNASRPNSRPSSRPQSPTGTPEQHRSPLGGPSRSSASPPVPVPVRAPMHPAHDPRRPPPAEVATPSAPPLPQRPSDRTGSPSVAPQQRFTARTNSGRPRECHKCRKPLTQIGRPNGHLSDAQQRVAGVEIGGKLYHPECVTCKACGKPITSTQEMHKGGRYHAKCHKKKYGIICDCCHERIEGDGPHVYFLHSRFWNERYCTKHESDGSVSCTGCARMRRPHSDDIAEIGDGRYICLECLSSIVPDTAAAQPLYNEIGEFYRSQLHMQIPEVPPLMLVENSGLNEACDREGRSGAINGPVTHTRGLCLIERVSSVRTGRIAQDAHSGGLTSRSEMVPLRVDPNCNVIAIIVLAGLPRVVTGAVIAHELMHAWLREHGIRKLPEQVEEGLCQLMSYLWIEAQQLEDDPLQARLASYVGYTIRTHPSDIYGKGFVLALEAYQRLGLKRLLDHVRLTTAFPAP